MPNFMYGEVGIEMKFVGTVLIALTLVSTCWVFIAQLAEVEFRQGRLDIAQMALQLFADLLACSVVSFSSI